MMQFLPPEILDWSNSEKIILDNHHNDGLIGCLLQVHLDYPDEHHDDLHNLHEDYPLATEKIKVTKEMLSDYQLQIVEDIFSW